MKEMQRPFDAIHVERDALSAIADVDFCDEKKKAENVIAVES